MADNGKADVAFAGSEGSGKPGSKALEAAGGQAASAPAVAVNLTKQIGLFSSVTIIVGNIVGSGVFLTPGGVLAKVIRGF